MDTDQEQRVVANLSAVHRTLDVFITLGDLESAANIAKTLGEIWVRHRYLDDGIHYLSTILNSPGVDGLSDKLLVALYGALGDITQGRSQFEQAMAHYKTALAKQIDDPRTMWRLLMGMGMAAYQRGQLDVAREYCNKALALAQQMDMTEGMVHGHQMLGELAVARGNIAESLDQLAYAQALSEERGYRLGLAHSLNSRGEVERARHDYRSAVDCYQASAALFKMESPSEFVMARGNLAFALLAAGDLRKAEALFADGHRYWEALQSPKGSAICLTGLAGVQISMHSYQDAARLLSLANERFALSDGGIEVADRLEYERIEALIQAHVSADELRSIQERVAREECHGRLSGPEQQTETTALFGEVSALSSRELEVLHLISQGLTDRQIAAHCFLSRHTVNSHLRAVYRKLKVNNRPAALHVAHRQGWL
jgi:non-specific serine/threonine protein kinase